MSTRSSYAASTNPARKAKRARLGNSTDASQDPADLRSASPHQPFILPKPASKPIVDTPPATTLPPVKRGRKPSGVSRASREAQRKLNHSIIEKARRTKINEALSTLSSLIPADYDTRPDGADDTGKEDAEDGDEDAEDLDGSIGWKGKGSGLGEVRSGRRRCLCNHFVVPHHCTASHPLYHALHHSTIP